MWTVSQSLSEEVARGRLDCCNCNGRLCGVADSQLQLVYRMRDLHCASIRQCVLFNCTNYYTDAYRATYLVDD